MNGVVFDLDGTLADTLDDLTDALNHVLAARGLPRHARDDVRQFIGSGARTLIERALPPERQALVDEVLREFRARYAAHLVVRTAPYPGVPELLAALATRGVPFAVLSNKPDDATREVVARLFPGVPFAAVVGERPGVPRKPDPTATLAVVRDLGRTPADCAFVGDSDTDIETARAAGLAPVGVAWGFRPPELLRAAGARVILRCPVDVLRLLGGP